MIKQFRHFQVKRSVATVTAFVMAAFCVGNPVAAAIKSEAAKPKAQSRKPIAPYDEFASTKRGGGLNYAERPLNAEEWQAKGRGAARNANLNGVMPWHRSFRDVNMSTGNLFKSFTDIQVSPARGAGLAWQRTYNSNDERVGPFGIGWTHAYDIRIEEGSTANDVPRTDFFGGKHHYTRDADGLYSPPAYMFDELSSEYDDFLVNGPTDALSDDQKGMDGTVKHFIKNGNARTISTITDRHGNQTSFTYGLNVTIGGVNQNLLTRVTDPSGRYLDITWTDVDATSGFAYRITQVAGPIDPITSNPIYTVAYEYNGDFNLWKVRQDPGGLNRITTYTYTNLMSEYGLLNTISDPLGHTVTYSYMYPQTFNPTNTIWVQTVTEPANANSTLTWTFSVGYGDATYPVSCTVSEPSGLSVVVASDSQLRKRFMSVDGAVYMHYQEYDSQNNVTKTLNTCRNPMMASRSLYESLPSVTQEMTYGPHGNVLTQKTVGFSGTTTTSYYDATKYFQKATVTDPNSNVTSFDYFASTDMSAGNRGNVKWVRDARYSTIGEQYDYTYNSYGQKLTETNLNNIVTEYTYGDTWGNLTHVVQDPGMGNLNRTTTMEYDAAGRVLESTDPKNQTNTFEYNAVGQPVEATLPGETVTYTYGANGRTETVEDNRGVTTIAYLAATDRVSSVDDPVTDTISYTYLSTGERSTLVLPGGNTWNYTYDSTTWKMLPSDDPNSVSRMLHKIADDQSKEVEYCLSNDGAIREVKQTLATGNPAISIKTRYEFDSGTYNSQTGSHRWLAELKNTKSVTAMGGTTTTTIVENDYTYDQNGNRLTNAISDNNGLIRTEDYGYDPLSRLTSVDYDDGQTQTYTFDAMGNRTQKADSVSGTENYTYNNANMLLTRGANSYTNDSNGNTLTGGGRTNTWDGQDRLTQCVFNSTTTTFTYGADGLRHSRTTGGTTTNHVLEGDNVLRELQSGSSVATYFHGPRGPESRRDGSNVYRWYVYDGLGNVLAEVDGSGNVTATRKYDVYGTVRANTGTGVSSHMFNGGLGHPSEGGTDLIYMRARFYDPTVGRFTSEDISKDGANWYAYAGGNPVKYGDRSGNSLSILPADVTLREFVDAHKSQLQIGFYVRLIKANQIVNNSAVWKHLVRAGRSLDEIEDEWRFIMAEVTKVSGPGSGTFKAFARMKGRQVLEYIYANADDLLGHDTPYVDWPKGL